MRRILQIVVALLIAIGAGLFVHSLADPPPTVWVPFVAAPVPAGQRLTAADISWRQVVNPPATAYRGPTSPVGQVARHALVPGQAVSVGDLGGLAATALRPGEVLWMAPVSSAAASGLPVIGARVEVWAGIATSSNGVSVPQLLARGVRVVGLYTAAGAPIVGAASGSPLTGTTSIGILGLAVPSRDLAPLLAGQGLTFVVDPSATHFQLVVTPALSTPPKP